MSNNCNPYPTNCDENLTAIQLIISNYSLSANLDLLEDEMDDLQEALSDLCTMENTNFSTISDLLDTMTENNEECCAEILALKAQIDALIDVMEICETDLPTTTTIESTTTLQPATTTEQPTTTIEGINCGEVVEYTGGESYPTEETIILGSTTGLVTLTYDVYTIPDLILVYFDGSIVINTGYRGYGAFYDFGGAGRTSFKAALYGKADPVNGGTYPNTTNYPDDGYPRVTSGDVVGYPGRGTATFNKTTTTATATVKIYAPMGGTAWSFTLGCPV